MNVEVSRPTLLAARRLCSAAEQRSSCMAFAPASSATTRASASTVPSSGLRVTHRDDREATGIAQKKAGFSTASVAAAGDSATAAGRSHDIPVETSSTIPTGEGTEQLLAGADAPLRDAELTGMGVLPFVWYDGSVSDLEQFGAEPLETDEVASAPDVSDHDVALYTSRHESGQVKHKCTPKVHNAIRGSRPV